MLLVHIPTNSGLGRHVGATDDSGAPQRLVRGRPPPQVHQGRHLLLRDLDLPPAEVRVPDVLDAEVREALRVDLCGEVC